MSRQLARLVAGAGAVLVVTGLAISPWVFSGGAAGPVPDHLADWLSQLANAVAFGFVGTAIAERTQGVQSRVGWVLLVTGVCQAGTFATTSWLARPGAAPAAVHWVDGWVWAPAILATLVLLPALYPTGSPAAGFRWLPVVGGLLVVAVSVAAGYDALLGRSLPGVVPGVLGVLVALTTVAALVSLVVRYRAARRREQGQVRWLLWSVLLLVAAELAVPLLPEVAATTLLLALPLTVPLAVGLAVLRYGLFDIDLLLSRTLTYLLLSTVLLVCYVGLVAALGEHVGGDEQTRSGVLALLVVALVASPLRDAAQRAVRRLFWGPAADRQQALAELARRIGASPSVQDSPRIVCEALATALRAPVQLTAGEVVVATTGDPAPVLRQVDVSHAGRQVGAIRIGPRSSGSLVAREEQLLEDVAAAVAPVLDTLRLTEDLRLARARVLEARDRERARLHRDLHDGLGPTLAGITLGLDAARALVGRAPDAAETSLARLGELAAGATAEVRRVVDDLSPGALDELDLAEAIRWHTGLAGVEPAVRLHAQDLPPLPRVAEAVALRVVLEAVTNVRRHASATRCEVFLAVDADRLHLAVDDDGVGLAAGSGGGTGVGLTSMLTRVESLGGALHVVRSPLGGTRVEADIPVGAVS